MNTTPERIIDQIDQLPAYAQREVFDALVPPIPYGSKLAQAHRIPDMADELRDGMVEEVLESALSGGDKITEEARAYAGDGVTDVAVALLDGDKFEDQTGPKRKILAAVELLLEAIEGYHLSESHERTFEYCAESLRDIARTLDGAFVLDPKGGPEQMRPWLDAWRTAARLHGSKWPHSLEGEVPGIMESPHELRGLHLLRELDRLDVWQDQVNAIQSETDAVLWIAPTDPDLSVREWRFDEVIVCERPVGGLEGKITRQQGGKIVMCRSEWGGEPYLELRKPRATKHGERVSPTATIIVKGSKA